MKWEATGVFDRVAAVEVGMGRWGSRNRGLAVGEGGVDEGLNN